MSGINYYASVWLCTDTFNRIRDVVLLKYGSSDTSTMATTIRQESSSTGSEYRPGNGFSVFLFYPILIFFITS